MGYYDNILNLISLVLALSILFIILFGCQFHKYVEKFTDADTTTTTPEAAATTTPATTTPATTTPAATTADEEAEKTKGTVKSLKSFDAKILTQLNEGKLTDADMQKMIDDGTFTRENLDNILKYIQELKKNMV
jgi:hypothetical protein